MSLHNLAKQVQKKGRNGDSMLVHMTPREVAGLQAIARAKGGSLTVNPDTGLVEAGFLKDLLPVLAGAALTYFAPGVGTAIGGSLGLGGAAGTGMLVGGLEALRTGDLMRGVTAGLGAYGGAGLTGAAGAGAGSTAANTSNVGIKAGAQGVGAGTGVTPTASGFLGTGGEGTLGALSPTAGGATGVTSSAPLYTPNLAATGGEGIGKYALAASAPMVAGALEPPPPPDTTRDMDERYKRAPYRFNLSPDFQGYTPTPPSPAYRPTGLGYAAGGQLAGQTYDDEYGQDQFAMGGLATLMSKGRYLKGDGDGMSDSIPAVINDKQPARLADGEFVVPADVVSHLGNGSSDAGAKKLYKMMDKVRVARTGKKQQAPEVKTDRYLPV